VDFHWRIYLPTTRGGEEGAAAFSSASAARIMSTQSALERAIR